MEEFLLTFDSEGSGPRASFDNALLVSPVVIRHRAPWVHGEGGQCVSVSLFPAQEATRISHRNSTLNTRVGLSCPFLDAMITWLLHELRKTNHYQTKVHNEEVMLHRRERLWYNSREEKDKKNQKSEKESQRKWNVKWAFRNEESFNNLKQKCGLKQRNKGLEKL